MIASELSREKSLNDGASVPRLESVVLFNPALPSSYKLRIGEPMYVTEHDFTHTFSNIKEKKAHTIVVSGGGNNHEIDKLLKASDGKPALLQTLRD